MYHFASDTRVAYYIKKASGKPETFLLCLLWNQGFFTVNVVSLPSLVKPVPSSKVALFFT